jgi:spermidine synthase
MTSIAGRSRQSLPIATLALLSGFAALSWEVLWQIKSSLALGVSAWGTAITLAVTMAGMCIGSLLMARLLRDQAISRPLAIYGGLELLIGSSGLFLDKGFRSIEAFDTWIYAGLPAGSPLVHALGIGLVLGLPTLGMGATIPVFGLVGRQFGISIATLYGLNTLGAAAGALLAAFLLIPMLGVAGAIVAVALINAGVGIACLALRAKATRSAAGRDRFAAEPALTSPEIFAPGAAYLCVAVTGFATLALEIAWFRSLTAAFQSTTSAFAVMLAAMLVALGAAAWLTPYLKARQISLGLLVGCAGMLILLATPLIERFDLLPYSEPPLLIVDWFVWTLLTIGAPVVLLGTALPWLLDDQDSPRQWGRLYAINTLAAIAGALCAAWVFLPSIGFARTAWLTGALVAGTGISLSQNRRQLAMLSGGIAAFAVAVMGESGAGRTRIQGWVKIAEAPTRILEVYEGPEATVAAVGYADGAHALVINGFVAASEHALSHYMPWMGRLPMLAHPDPQNALVICFGTGQTANAVRQENPRSLDIVDINPRVPLLAHHFPLNEGVIDDPRVRVTIMDGRAYLRRSTKIYDVITLEPMPPTFAGVNALYSKEFYELAAQRLSRQGVIAQWLPFHLVAPDYSVSIVKSFAAVFPNSILWIDPLSRTGILLGSKDPDAPLGKAWPGFARTGLARDLDEAAVNRGVTLDRAAISRYGSLGVAVTDDNQRLAYGNAVNFVYGHNAGDPVSEHQALIDRARRKGREMVGRIF